MKNYTYKGKPTKYRQKENTILKASFIILVISAGLINSIFYRPTYKVPPKIEKPQIQAPVTSQATSSKIVKPEIIALPIKIAKTPKAKEVEFRIREIAHQENFKWPDYLVKLINCESQFRTDAVNIYGNNPVTSKDRGLLQFNSHWQARVSDECAYNLDCSVKEAIKMINNGQQDKWVCNDIILASK